MTNDHISIYMPAFNGGGAENAIVRLLNHWAEVGRDVRLIVNQDTGPLKDKLSKDVSVTALGVKSTFANIPRLILHLRKDRPWVFMTALLSPNVAGLLAARLSGLNLPVVSLVRNQTTPELQTMPSWRSSLIRPMLRVAYRRADAIGCVATPVSEDLVQLFDLNRSKVHETFNPIILPDPESLNTRPDYFPETGPVILAIGRLVPQKDYQTVLKAFAKYRASAEGHLVVLGDGPLQEDMKALAAELGVSEHVTWAGFQPAPHAALAHADLFILLSLFEGFPNVIGEALACGNRIVATDAPGGTADILENGTYGHLVPVGGHEEAAAAMAQALSEPLQRERQINRAKEFSIEAIAERYVDLCKGAALSRSGK